MLVLLSGTKPVGQTAWISKARRRRRTSASRYSTPVMGTDADDVQRIIERGVQQARDGVKNTRLLRAIEMRSADEIIAAVPLEPLMAMTQPLANVYGKQIVRGANRQVDEFGREDTFNAADARVINAAGLRAGNLVTRITQEQRASLRGAIVDAASGQFSVDDTAKIIRSSIGLTTRYENAVKNNYFKTKQSLMAAGLGERAAAETASKSAEKYAARLTRSRARTIARTELHQSNNVGRQLAWDELVQEGFIGPDQYKVWVANPSACSICLELDGESVPLNEPFSNGDLQAEAHPNCMCIAELETLTERDAREEAERQGTAETDSAEPEPAPTQAVAEIRDSAWIDQNIQAFDDEASGYYKLWEDSANNPNNQQHPMSYTMTKRLGLNGLPTVVSREQMDDLVANNPGRQMYRGLEPAVNKPATVMFEDLKGGDMFVGTGSFGHGIYFAARGRPRSAGKLTAAQGGGYVTNFGRATATETYATERGLVMRATLRPDAKIIKDSELFELDRKIRTDFNEYVKERKKEIYAMHGESSQAKTLIDDLERRQISLETFLSYDMANAARLSGYDVIKTYGVGGADEDHYWNVLNRKVIIVQDEPDWNAGKYRD